ncbi:MAG: class I SAM-dependent methyltransferase [Acidimicrobiales bacterium]
MASSADRSSDGAGDGFDASTYGEGFADVYDEWYESVSDAAETVAAVARLARRAGGDNSDGNDSGDGEPGTALELGCGTGRLLLPLAETGTPAVGLDASPAMLARLAAKPGAERVRARLGDMAAFDLRADGPFAVVFAAFNTFFNLTSRAAQERCLRLVHEHLAPGGRLALECFAPADLRGEPIDAVEVHSLTVDRVVLRVSVVDPAAQLVTGQHVELSNAGVRLRPWRLRYASPAELDEMAAAAGFTLEARSASWQGGAFTAGSRQHVSIYRREEADRAG